MGYLIDHLLLKKGKNYENIDFRIACYCFIILLAISGCSGLKTSSNTTGVTPDENISVERTNLSEGQNEAEEIIEEQPKILIKAEENLKDRSQSFIKHISMGRILSWFKRERI